MASRRSRQALQDHPDLGSSYLAHARLELDRRPRRPHVRGRNRQRPTPHRHLCAPLGSRPQRRASSARSPSGGPPTGSTRRTTVPPEQDNCRRLPPCWQDHLDRSVADCSDDLNRLHVRAHEARSTDRRHEDQQRVPQPRATRPNSAAQRRVIGAPRRQVEGSERTGYPVGRLRAARPTAEYSSIRSRAGAPRRPRRVSSLRCGPRRLGLQRGRL